MMRTAMALLAFLAVTYAVAALGAVLTARSVADWYPGLTKPSWTPPAWVFGPVWSLLYTLMAVAAWLVWRRLGGAAATLPLALYGLQLGLNLAWSALFFYAHQPAWALVDIVALWLAIVGTLLVFWRAAPPAGGLLVPYLLWVSYALTLNYGIWRLNP